MVYTVTCNPALDYVMFVPELSPSGVHRAAREMLTYGGKGINVSAILTRLGVPTQALGFVAGFTGEKLKTLLRADGIPCDFVELAAGDTRINVKIKAETEMDFNAAGPTVGEADVERLLEQMDRLQPEDVLVLAGSVSENLPRDLYERMLVRLKGKSVRIVVDAEAALLRETLPHRPFLIKPNHHELGEFFGKELTDLDAIVEHAHRLQEMGARNVLVSRAADGAVLLDETGACHTVGTVAGEVVNSVGCGDSMVAGFLAGWLQTGDYAHALRLGAACGSATAFSPLLATKAEIDRCLQVLK
ncbi:MAG: 1-phosphofructokinase [Clostridia bacterium]|nr:1-phosphofructokinase [Clostridia bacterium]